ncbi:hypothetical protein GIB67_010189, partial [Kingdonia uniflora]
MPSGGRVWMVWTYGCIVFILIPFLQKVRLHFLKLFGARLSGCCGLVYSVKGRKYKGNQYHDNMERSYETSHHVHW